MRQHHISFKHAWDGIVWVFKTQPNFRFHSFAAVAALGASWFFHISRFEFLIIAFTIMLVIITEMLNTAVEAMTDLITTEYHERARVAKDVSAGMVLMSAFFSIGIGLVVFGPRLITLLPN